jgi:acetyltransferase-like isoleucine patch superfamily enzyme
MPRALRMAPRRLFYGSGARIGPLPRLASGLRRRWVLLRHPHATVRFEGPCYLGPGFSLHIPDAGTFVAGPGVEFRRGFRAEIAGDGRVTIGAGSVFTYDVLLQCTTAIEIGARCTFAQDVLVVDGNHRFRGTDEPVLAQGYDYRPIRIEDDAFISAKSTVIADVGRRALVAANAVVTRAVPAYCVAGGVPARVLDHFGPPGTEPPEAPAVAGG